MRVIFVSFSLLYVYHLCLIFLVIECLAVDEPQLKEQTNWCMDGKLNCQILINEIF